MKNILLLVHQDAGQGSALPGDNTRALEGRLYCLDVTVRSMIAPGYRGGGTVWTPAAKRQRAPAWRT